MFFIALFTHEIRRTGHKDIVAPFTRINDGKMFLVGFQKASKLEALNLLTKIQNGGSHLGMKKFFHRQLTQIRFEPSKNFLALIKFRKRYSL